MATIHSEDTCFVNREAAQHQALLCSHQDDIDRDWSVGARMLTELDEAVQAFDQRLRGRHVTSTRMFLYTLQIYVASEVGDSRDLEIWCEPSWHIRTPSGVLTGSGAIESPSTFDDDAEVARAGATITRVSEVSKALVGRAVTELVVDPITQALTVQFSEGMVVATFSDDPDGDALWVLRDPENDDAIRGTARGLARGTRAHRA